MNTKRLQDLKTLARKGQQFYASKYMRRQWFKGTVRLIEEGKHMLVNGKFPVH